MKRVMMIILVLVLLIVAAFSVYSYPALGRSPRGARLARIEQSPNYRNGQFQNQTPTPVMTSRESRWKALWKFIFAHYKDLKPEKSIPTVKSDLLHLDRRQEI